MRDFESRVDYDAFRALTASSVTLKVDQGTPEVTFVIPATIKDSYEIGLSGQGDLVRGNVSYVGIYDPTATAGATITVTGTTENIS
jgi:hypothetical protein